MLRTSELILNFVLNSCWQIAAVFAVAWVGSRLLKSGPARYRHALWVVALVACFVVPLLTTTRFVPDWISRFRVIPKAENTIPAVTTQEITDDQTIDHLTTRRTKPISTTTRTALFFTLAYGLFILGRSVRLVRFWRRKEKLRRSATQTGLPNEVLLAAERCRRMLGIENVSVARSDKARVPYTLGARGPLILLPDSFCSDADESRLLCVIGHEMAHVARRDFLSNLLCELISLPISFHPLTFLIKQQIDRTRELACDELVTRHVLEPRVYARSLLWAADVSQQHSSQAFMLSIFDGKILEERIMRLTRKNKRLAPGVARAMMLAALFVLCVSAMSLSMFSLELQTQARAIVQPLQTLRETAPQEPVDAPATTVPQPRREVQLNASTPDDRAKAACEAGRRGDIEAIPYLVAMLGDDSKTQRLDCYNTGRWSPALVTFKHPSPGEQAALALASFGRTAYRPLSNQLDSSNATVRRNAAWAIGELTNMVPGERAGAVPQLISLLSDPDEWV